jgi:hypothetical protein
MASRIVAAEKVRWHADRNVRNGEHLAGKGGGLLSLWLLHEIEKAGACRFLRNAI